MKNLTNMRYQNYIKLLTLLVTKREDVRIYLNLLLTLCAIAFFGWFAIKPTLQTIFELRQHIKEHQETLAKLEQKSKDLAKAQQELQIVQDDIAKINQAVPDKAVPYIAGRQLEALAAKDQVKLSSVSFGKITLLGKDNDTEKLKVSSKLPPKTRVFTISFLVEATPEKTFAFLKDFSNMRQSFIWETSSVVGKPANAATSLALSVNGYALFQESEAGQ